jgi:hypothetical protein
MKPRTQGGIVALALTATLAIAPAALAAKPKTETIRAFSKNVSFTYTSVDGTVTQGPPSGQPAAGDVFEIDSLDYVGTHTHHAKQAAMSDYLRCTFLPSLEPECYGYVAIDGSLVRFHNMDVIGGTGRYQGVTGKTLKNEEVPGGSDIAIRLRLR